MATMVLRCQRGEMIRGARPRFCSCPGWVAATDARFHPDRLTMTWMGMAAAMTRRRGGEEVPVRLVASYGMIEAASGNILQEINHACAVAG